MRRVYPPLALHHVCKISHAYASCLQTRSVKRRNQPQGGPDPAHGHRASASASASSVAGWKPHGQPAVLKPRHPHNANTNTTRTRAAIQLAKQATAHMHPGPRGGAGAGSGSCESRAPGVHSRGQGSMCIRIRAAVHVNSGRTQIKAGPRILIPERGSWRPALRNAAALAVESARGGGSPVVCRRRAINVRIRVTEIPRPSTHGHPVSPAAGWAAPPRPASAAKGDISSNQRRSTAAATPRPRAALLLVAISIG